MKKPKITILVVVLIVTTFLFGCASNVQQNQEENLGNNKENVAYPIEIVDGTGNSITVHKKPQNVVSIDPSQTEILFALDLDEKVVGVSNYCDYPAEALKKEKIGDAFTIDIEKILELDPDIVFIYGTGQPSAVEQMKANGITVIGNAPETTDEIFNTILQIGKIMDSEGKAKQLVNKMREEMNSIANRFKDKERVRVFYQIWDQPLMTAGKDSFIDELIDLAGGKNIASDVKGAALEYSVEGMIEKDPEVYIAPAHSEDNYNLNDDEIERLKNIIKTKPGYDAMSAVKNDRIELLEPNIVSRRSVRAVEALELFARAIHPEAF